jgi:hypothetical protein
MQKSIQDRRDLILLSSIVLVILMYPVLDYGDLRRVILGILVFVPVVLATLRMVQTRSRVWPSVLLVCGTLASSVASVLFPNRSLLVIKWGFLTAFFGLTVVYLFAYILDARTVTASHLFTAVSIYLLLGILFFSLYCAVDLVRPGSFHHGNSNTTERPSELLYFSLITLSTIGYGDIVPASGEVRMFAALEGIVGVLYLAITIALLVSAYRWHGNSDAQ